MSLTVRMSKSALLNLGDFQNMKVEIEIEAPVRAEQMTGEMIHSIGESIDRVLLDECFDALRDMPYTRRSVMLTALGLTEMFDERVRAEVEQEREANLTHNEPVLDPVAFLNADLLRRAQGDEESAAYEPDVDDDAAPPDVGF